MPEVSFDTPPDSTELRFPAMGSEAHVVVTGGRPGLAEQARRRLAALEGRWSRFVPTSETSALTHHAGDPVVVSDDTRLLVERALAGWETTGGVFDPTVLGHLIRAGYDRSFELVARAPAAGASSLLTGCAGIEVHGRSVRLPRGTGFDPGGIGKGLAADLVVEELLREGARGACVNVGGDLRVEGAAPDGGTWTVAVDDPHSEEPLVLLGLGAGAVATSSTRRRRWLVDGEARHHLVHAATGRSAVTDLVQVTVVTGDAWRAEVLATAVLLLGSLRGFPLLTRVAAEALAVDVAGRVHTTPELSRFTHARAPHGACTPVGAGG